jgi:hypothetical protein
LAVTWAGLVRRGEATIVARAQVEEAPYRKINHSITILDPAEKPFTYHFTAPLTTHRGQLVLQLGGAEEDYTMYLDNVSLVEHAD